MPLQFPTNPTTGEVYQSGSSTTYQYNGSYWITAPESVLTIQQALSASFTPSHRRDITATSHGPYGNAFIIADGKLFSHLAGPSATVSRTAALYSVYQSANRLSGADFIYQIPFPTEAGNLVEANVYNTSAYALFDNGNLYTWGNNSQGQLGTGDTTFRGLPTLVQTGVTQVYWDSSQNYGEIDYCYLLFKKTDGFVYGFGYNADGQLGLGNTTNVTSATILPGIGQNPLYVGACNGLGGSVIVQKADGTIVVSGYNQSGQLGIGNTTNQNTFTTSSGWTHGTSSMYIVDHVAGAYYPGSTTAGSIQVWLSNGTSDILMGAGQATNGSIANGGTSGNLTTPVKQTTVTERFQKILRVGNYAGTCHLLTTSGNLYGWGYNTYGAIGNGNTTTTSTPTLIMSGVLDIYQSQQPNQTGLAFTGPIAKKSDGYYCWGTNAGGTIGDGTATQRNSPVKMRFPQGFNIKHVASIGQAADSYAIIAIGDDNRYYCWGDNPYYAVATETNTDVLSPREFSPRVLQR